MTAILGLSAYYHDAAAALVVDGAVVAAAQEERFTRVKHDHRFPRHAVDYCLRAAGLGIDDLDYVGFYDKPLRKFERMLETYLAEAPRGYESFKTYLPEWTLRTAAGEIVKHGSGTPRPDPSNAEFREWWSGVVAAELKRAPIDGVFVDALPQALTPGLARAIGADKAKAVVAGLREMIALTKRKIGADKILLANGTRTTDFREMLDWEGIDGVMIEHFAGFKTDHPIVQRACDTFTMHNALR